jgi:hypothetical protein
MPLRRRAIAAGRPEAAGEFLQQPENGLAGYVRWSDCRSQAAPDAISTTRPGPMCCIRASIPRMAVRSIPTPRRYSPVSRSAAFPSSLRRGGTGHQSPILRCRWRRSCARSVRALVLSKTFTLDACRHGGMIELEEAGLTAGQGRALSAHRSKA